MTSDDLLDDYQTLRSELDAAYSDGDWDSGRIDRIAAQLASLEQTMSALRIRAPAHDGEA